MENQMIRNLKIVGIFILTVGIISFILYLIYGLTILWQAVAAGIITGFLLLVVLLLAILSIYLWIKNLIIKRDLRKYQTELKYCKSELSKLKENSNSKPK